MKVLVLRNGSHAIALPLRRHGKTSMFMQIIERCITAGVAVHITQVGRRCIQMSRYSKDDSLFNTDKEVLMLWVLDHYDVKFRESKRGWQKVSCFNEYGHSGGDKNPSGSVNLGFGYYRCFSCELNGDGYAILRELEGWGVKQVNEASGGQVMPSDERGTWL